MRSPSTGLRSFFAAVDDWLFVPEPFALKSPFSVDDAVRRVQALVKFADEGKLGFDLRLEGSVSADEVIIRRREFLRARDFEFRGKFMRDEQGCLLFGQFTIERFEKIRTYYSLLILLLVIAVTAWFSPQPIIAIVILGVFFGVTLFVIFAMRGQQNDVDEEEITLALHAVLSEDG